MMPPYLKSRTAPIYSSSAVLLITQPGFPWGSAVQSYTPSNTSGQAPVATGDLTRLTSLTNLYVQIANSDIIQARVAKKAPTTQSVVATQNYSLSPSLYSSPLPIMTITARSRTKALAIADAQASADVLVAYLKHQQSAARITPSDRVVVQQLQAPKRAVAVNPTKKTLPAVVFLTIMLAVVGLAFVLENMRPHAAVSVMPQPEADRALDGSARRRRSRTA
jgi:hypothetical protein